MEKLKHIFSETKFFIGSLISAIVLLYASFVFFYKIQNLPERVTAIEETIELYSKEHESIRKDLISNRSYYDLSSAKLEATLLGIQSDIQLIKQIVMQKGLD